MNRSVTFSFIESRWLLTLVLLAAVAWSLFFVPWSSNVVHSGGAAAALEILRALLSPELSPSFLLVALEASWKTISFAAAGITLAVAIGLPLGVVASGVLVSSPIRRWTSIAAVRLILAALRSVHELVWAWLLVLALGLSPIAAVLALGIPYGGILGRIFSEILNDVPEGPLRSLRSAGASELEVLVYGRLPMALPQLVSYTLYRFECGIRSAAILSFVGIAGLGYQVQLSLDDLLYNEVWTLLLFLVALVVLVDIWSNLVRRSLTS